MKLKSLELAKAIRVGSKTPAETFLSVDKRFQMEIMPGGSILKVVNEYGERSFTTIYNVIWFDTLDEPAQSSAKKGRDEAAANG